MRKLYLMIAFLLAATVIFAQQKILTGTVTDKSNGKPLAGVTIQAGKAFAITDEAGKFSIAASVGESVVFTNVGMTPYKHLIAAADQNVSIAMDEDASGLNAVVVTGYTTEKKKDIQGAVTVVKMADVLQETNANILTSLQSRVPGLDISTDGAPGGGTFANIRGLASINNNTPPLYIIDGVPTYDFNGLSPYDIESMQVLKDAASAAIYGARASSGVIIITTKRGKSGKAKVTFDTYYGQKSRRNTQGMLNALQYGQANWQSYGNDNNGATPSDPTYGNGPQPVIPAYIDAPDNTTPSGNTDWQKETFQPAANYSFNLGVSQALEKSNFYFGVNYVKEDGLAKLTYYDRLNVRVNTSFALNKHITVGENLSLGYLTGNRENSTSVLQNGVAQLQIIPLKDNLGNWAGPFNNLGDFLNPVGMLNLYKQNINKGWRTFGNVFADIEILKGLTYHTSFAVDLATTQSHFFFPVYKMGRFINTTNSLSENDVYGLNLTATNTLTYHWTKGKHDVQILGGYEWLNNQGHNVAASASGFISTDPDYTYLSSGSTVTGASGTAFEYGLVGLFGKLNYSYEDRYLFSASVRRDGSSRFGPSKQYGVFPAFSAAWRMSEEKFFATSKIANTISDLKLRATWGQNGNDNIKDYNYATFFAPSIDFANYDILGSNTNSQTGYIVSSIGNASTQWEASTQTNIGVDVGFLNNRLYVSADYYVKTSSHLLYQPQLPAVNGEGTPPFINVGDIRNSGFEMMLTYKSSGRSKFKYQIDLSFSTNKNEVLSVGQSGNDSLLTDRGIIKKGQPLGEFYGYEYDGLNKTAQELANYTDQTGKANNVGSMRFKDVNGDGVVNANDRTALGSPFAKFQFGVNFNLSYGPFDAAIFFDSKIGPKIYDEWLNILDFMTFTSNKSTAILSAWTPQNSGSNFPALTGQDYGQTRTSSFFISDASFLRLKSINVGYNLPSSFLSKVGISRTRFFVQAEDLFTLTKFKGYDYETLYTGVNTLGVLTQNQYPHTKGWAVGLSLGF